jgi:hypothetical protein
LLLSTLFFFTAEIISPAATKYNITRQIFDVNIKIKFFIRGQYNIGDIYLAALFRCFLPVLVFAQLNILIAHLNL